MVNRLFLLIALLPLWAATASAQEVCYYLQAVDSERQDQLCIYFDVQPTPTELPTPTNTQVIVQATATPTPTAVAASGLDVFPGQSVNAAIASAPVGSILKLHAGSYNTENILVNKTVTLQAAGDGPVVIDKGCTGTGITVTGDDVGIYGLNIRNVSVGIAISGDTRQPARAKIRYNNITKSNCDGTGEQLAAGIQAYYAGPGHIITNNTIDNSGPRHGNGIWFKSASGAGRESGGGHYIASNTITGGFDGIGGEVENDIHGSFDRDTVIENNTISKCADDGIQVEGGDKNVLVRNNTIKECGSGIAAAAPFSGPLTLEGNTIISSTFGELGQLVCFKVGNDTPEITYITNNICTLGPGGKGVEQTNSGIGVIVARGNKFNVNSYIYEFPYNTPRVGSSFDLDCMHTTDAGRFVKWNNVVYNTLARFQAATKQEMGATTGPC